MKIKNLLATILCIAMVLSTMTTVAFAEDEAFSCWKEVADTTWYNDADTEFVISSAKQLAGFGLLVDKGNTFEGKTVKLGSDIDLYAMNADGEKASFDPIGYGYNVVFKGTFDGQGHTISNLYQNGWALGLDYSTEGGGLFASVVNAKIKNLNIDNAEIVMECIDMGIIVGYSYGTCTYENIKISNSVIANYNRYTGGVVGEVNGIQTFNNVDVDSTSTVSALWGTPDCVLGGIIGGKYGDASVILNRCDVACKIDAFNDVVANYMYYNYRLSGMLIGMTEEATDGTATASYLTATDCTVTFDEWNQYTYCEFESNGQGSYNAPDEFKHSRVQEGYATGGVDIDHTHSDVESHEVLLPFTQLLGGDKGVRGGTKIEGVKVTDKAKEARTVAQLWAPEYTARATNYVLVDSYETLEEAIAAAQAGYMVKLTKDIETDETVVIPADKNIILDLAGNKLSMTYATDVTANHELIKNLGNLTITDSEGEGKISYQYTGADTNFGKATNTITSEPGSVLTIEGGLIENLTTANGIAYAIDARTNGGAGDVELNINDGTITSKKIAVRIFANSTTNTGTLNVSDGEITGRVIIQNANTSANKAALNITGGTFKANEYKTDTLYVGGDNGATIDIAASISGGKFDGEILNPTNKLFISGGSFTVDPEAYVTEDTEVVKLGDDEGYEFPYIIAPKAASAITVDLAEAKDEDGKVIPGLYDIVLISADGRKIHEFVAAEFVFKNDSKTVGGSTMQYEVLGITEGDVVKTIVEHASKDEFNNDQYIINIPDGAKRLNSGEVTKSIVIGQVKFIGQGTINFSITDAEVDTTWQNTNLGRYYYSNDGTLNIAEANIENGSVEDITRDVVVKVTYNHDLVTNIWANNKITVTLKDGFGEVIKTEDVDGDSIADGIATFENVRIGRITVTLEAPGFRKFVYETTLDEGDSALVLNFWNDVKKDAYKLPIETGKTPVAHNFVVGDIVMDYIVDKYDLAAVTSYYGMYNIANNSKFLMYDLNRDGDIDIRDVQYVLHTMGK